MKNLKLLISEFARIADESTKPWIEGYETRNQSRWSFIGNLEINDSKEWPLILPPLINQSLTLNQILLPSRSE